MPIERNDAGVLEPAGDLGSQQGALPAGGIVGVMVENLLESHLAVQFEIEAPRARHPGRRGHVAAGRGTAGHR
jgi:hypothetical protein